MNEWVNAAIQRGEGPLQELQAEASQSVLDLALKPIMKPYLSSDWLDYERIHVSNAIIPELKRGARPYFGLVVSYELPMKVPFLNRSIVLEASAVERLWIGDTGETGTEGDGGAGEEQHSIVVLAKPNPGWQIIRARSGLKFRQMLRQTCRYFIKAARVRPNIWAGSKLMKAGISNGNGKSA